MDMRSKFSFTKTGINMGRSAKFYSYEDMDTQTRDDRLNGNTDWCIILKKVVSVRQFKFNAFKSEYCIEYWIQI